jgi:hypothetical protein
MPQRLQHINLPKVTRQTVQVQSWGRYFLTKRIQHAAVLADVLQVLRDQRQRRRAVATCCSNRLTATSVPRQVPLKT